MHLRRFAYYLRSVPTLLTGIRGWPTTIALFLRLPVTTPRTIELRASGLRLTVRGAMDVWIVKETCLDRDYERVGTDVQDGWRIVDIGAGLGDFSLDVARRHARSTIHAYEPSPGSFELLWENIRLNRIGNVQPFPEAVGSQTGQVELVVSGAAVQHRTTHCVTTSAVQVSALPLAVVLDRLGGDCDLLKMDCEGAEYDILLSADAATLGRIRRIVMEYHDDVPGRSPWQIVAVLERHGFRVTCHPSPAWRHLGFLYATRLQTADEPGVTE